MFCGTMTTHKRTSKTGVWKRTSAVILARIEKAEKIRDLAKQKEFPMMKLFEISNMSPSCHSSFMKGLSHDDRYEEVLQKIQSI